MRVLITRPRLDALRTAERVSALGHQALIDPVIVIRLSPFDASAEGIAAIVFTSANAVRAVASYDSLKQFRAFAVGPRTAAEAREHGFTNVSAAGGEVVSLGNLIAGALPEGAKVLHLAGENRAGDLPGHLAQSAITVETRITYRAEQSSAFLPETVQFFRKGSIDAVLHYSERSAASFVRLAEAAGILEEASRAHHLCLSSAVAAPLKPYGMHVRVAARPEEDALLALLGA